MNIPRILRNAFFFWLSLSAAAEQTQRNSRPLGRRGAALDELQPGEVSLQERDFFSQEDALAPVLSESPEMTVSKFFIQTATFICISRMLGSSSMTLLITLFLSCRISSNVAGYC